jgi:dTDP-4-dehydrorhamnose reductase
MASKDPSLEFIFGFCIVRERETTHDERMKIVVFGASGMIGSAFCRAAVRRGFEVEGFYNHNPVKIDGLIRAERRDLSDLQGLERPLLDRWPEVIVNAAAISEPEAVNEECLAASRINVDLPNRLAEISNHLGARYIHLSSDMVFDGANPPYRSTDAPNPLSAYGEQKLLAEKEVLRRCSDNLVVLRMTIVNGNSPSGHRSVHEKLLRALSKGKRPVLFEDEFRQPCSCENVAAALLELCQRPNLNGLFHWGGSERLSRSEMGLRILQRFALSEDLVDTGSRRDFPGQDERPGDLAFTLEPLVGKLTTRPSSYGDQLEEMAIPDDLYEWFRDNSKDPSCYARRLTVN